jgi:hypothetical protein
VKTTILANGTLSITPETDIEAYALSRWSSENITADWYDARLPQLKIVLDLSAYADQMAAGMFVTLEQSGIFQK